MYETMITIPQFHFLSFEMSLIFYKIKLKTSVINMDMDEVTTTEYTKEEPSFLEIDPMLESIEWSEGLYPIEVHLTGVS